MASDTTGTTDIEVEHRGAVAIAWFNRPQVLNAFRKATFDRLHQVLNQVEEDDLVTALVLTGRGRAFCAGEDLTEMEVEAGAGFTVRRALAELVRVQDLTRRLVAFRKPVLAAINGPAVGLGAELPLACDLRIAARSAYLFFSEPRRGMLQTNGAFHFLPPMVGHGRAAEWLLSARRIGADEALAAGYLSGVVPDEGLLEAVLDLASRVVGGGPGPGAPPH